MQKDFDKWNLEKKSIHSNQEFPFYNEREIWWCSLGVNVGFEQDGTGQKFDRPVLVIKGFNKNTFLCVGLTGKKKIGKYYFYLGKIEGRDSTAVLSQIRVIDTKRLIRKIETLEDKTFQELMKSVKKMIFD
jgi:mRNA interferase MazF